MIYNYSNNQQQRQFSSIADLFRKTKYINIVIFIAMLKSLESCHDRTVIMQFNLVQVLFSSNTVSAVKPIILLNMKWLLNPIRSHMY